MVVCCNQSFHHLQEEEFQFIILDEAHHLQARSDGWTPVLDKSNFKCDKVVELSATYYADDGIAPDFSMPMREAIERGKILITACSANTLTQGTSFHPSQSCTREETWGRTFHLTHDDWAEHFHNDSRIGSCLNEVLCT